MVPACYQRAGDCKKAWSAYKEIQAESVKDLPADTKETVLRSGFEAIVQKCKGK